MYGKKVFFIVSLVCAIIILGIGLLMKYFAINSSTGFAYLRTGGAVTTTLSANGALGLGIFGLLFSVWSYYEFVQSKKKRLEDLEIDRKDESKIEKRKTREAYLRRFGGRSRR